MDKKWKILWILAGVAVLLVVAFLIVGIVGACMPEEALVDENGEQKNNEVIHSILTVFRSDDTEEEPTAIPYPDLQEGDSVTVTDAPNGNTETATNVPSNTETATNAPSNTEKATNAPVATQAPTQEPENSFDGAAENDDFNTGNEVIVDFDDLFGEEP